MSKSEEPLVNNSSNNEIKNISLNYNELCRTSTVVTSNDNVNNDKINKTNTEFSKSNISQINTISTINNNFTLNYIANHTKFDNIIEDISSNNFEYQFEFNETNNEEFININNNSNKINATYAEQLSSSQFHSLKIIKTNPTNHYITELHSDSSYNDTIYIDDKPIIDNKCDNTFNLSTDKNDINLNFSSHNNNYNFSNDKNHNKLKLSANKYDKINGYDFWQNCLNSAKYILAPMVDQSELAWRMLSRRYGAQLCYTPMLHASVFIRDPSYRKESIATCQSDKPLIVQFCANNPETLLQAGKMVEGLCDAIDLNIGCPQNIAKRGHYGAFLQDEWELLKDMVKLCSENLSVPITCKIRIFEDVQKTIEYAQMLEHAGAKILTVHGRTREQNGMNTGLARWEYIKAVQENINIPVFANGNIQFFGDIEKCLKATGAQGVMSAEGSLHNPALFSGLNPAVWDMANEYLDLVELYPCPISFIRGHLFKLFLHILTVHPDFRNKLGVCKNILELRNIIQSIKETCLPDIFSSENNQESFTNQNTHLALPYWICQPFYRADENLSTEEKQERRYNLKRQIEMPNNSQMSLPILDPTSNPKLLGLSKNKLKKLERFALKRIEKSSHINKIKFEICNKCSNPKGIKCVFEKCRSCCRAYAYRNFVDCPGHKIYTCKQRENRNKALLTSITHTSGTIKSEQSLENYIDI